MWSVGRASNRPRAGVTLAEMLIVVTLLALMAGISFPAVSAGVDTLRLSGAADKIAALVNAALNFAERRQQAVEIAILPGENAVAALSADGRLARRVELSATMRIAEVWPARPWEEGAPRRFLLYPGGAPPRLRVLLVNRKGARRWVSLDPVAGMAIAQRGGESVESNP